MAVTQRNHASKQQAFRKEQRTIKGLKTEVVVHPVLTVELFIFIIGLSENSPTDIFTVGLLGDSKPSQDNKSNHCKSILGQLDIQMHYVYNVN